MIGYLEREREEEEEHVDEGDFFFCVVEFGGFSSSIKRYQGGGRERVCVKDKEKTMAVS